MMSIDILRGIYWWLLDLLKCNGRPPFDGEFHLNVPEKFLNFWRDILRSIRWRSILHFNYHFLLLRYRIVRSLSCRLGRRWESSDKLQLLVLPLMLRRRRSKSRRWVPVVGTLSRVSKEQFANLEHLHMKHTKLMCLEVNEALMIVLAFCMKILGCGLVIIPGILPGPSKHPGRREPRHTHSRVVQWQPSWRMPGSPRKLWKDVSTRLPLVSRDVNRTIRVKGRVRQRFCRDCESS